MDAECLRDFFDADAFAVQIDELAEVSKLLYAVFSLANSPGSLMNKVEDFAMTLFHEFV